MDTLLKTGMRVIPALISFIMLILFLLPMTAGIINLGNCVGALTSAALTAVFLFWDRFTGVVSHMWERPAGKVIISAFSAAAVVFTLVAVTVSFFMLREMNDRPRDTDTTVVVLGCKVKNGAPSLMLGRRLNAAFEYLSAEPDVKVIVSGGKGDDESISEAQCMRDYLVDRGISPERIYMEDKSTDTDENLRFSQDIIRHDSDRRLSPAPLRHESGGTGHEGVQYIRPHSAVARTDVLGQGVVWHSILYNKVGTV